MHICRDPHTEEFRLTAPFKILAEGPSVTDKFSGLVNDPLQKVLHPWTRLRPSRGEKILLPAIACIFYPVLLLPANRTNLEANISAKFRGRPIRKNAERIKIRMELAKREVTRK
jgi:hypothetical protein